MLSQLLILAESSEDGTGKTSNNLLVCVAIVWDPGTALLNLLSGLDTHSTMTFTVL